MHLLPIIATVVAGISSPADAGGTRLDATIGLAAVAIHTQNLAASGSSGPKE